MRDNCIKDRLEKIGEELVGGGGGSLSWGGVFLRKTQHKKKYLFFTFLVM